MPYGSQEPVGTVANIWMFQVLGSIPWQTYFQRVLPHQARPGSSPTSLDWGAF